jgi:hypothetical protein
VSSTASHAVFFQHNTPAETLSKVASLAEAQCSIDSAAPSNTHTSSACRNYSSEQLHAATVPHHVFCRCLADAVAGGAVTGTVSTTNGPTAGPLFIAPYVSTSKYEHPHTAVDTTINDQHTHHSGWIHVCSYISRTYKPGCSLCTSERHE